MFWEISSEKAKAMNKILRPIDRVFLKRKYNNKEIYLK